MILKEDNLIVTINNTIFRAKPFANPQFVFDPDALQGFLDGVDIKRNTTARPNQWGDFQEKTLLSSRRMTMTGTAIATSPAQLLSMRDEFTGLLVNNEYTEISIQNSTTTRYVTVSLDSQPAFIQQTDKHASWKIDLYAPDPRIYGPIRNVQLNDGTISGGLDYPMDYPVNYGGDIVVQSLFLTNGGNTDSWPKFKVTGDFFSGFSITNNAGSIITYDGIVTMSAPVIIDTATGTATQNGTDKSTMISRREWFSIPPNTTIQPLFLPKQDAVGWCEIIYRDTWI